MTWEEYLPLAEKTLSNQFHCESEFDQKVLHSIIGALTEIEEILQNYDDQKLITDPTKQGSIAEEVADIFWYLSILFRELNLELNFELVQSDNTPFKNLMNILRELLSFLDIMKKKIYYNKVLDNELMKNLTISIYSYLLSYCYQNNIDISLVLDKNIAKLKSRYGEKFSSEKAINRDLDKEKQILEN